MCVCEVVEIMANYLNFARYVFVFLLMFWGSIIDGHPQCLDSRPPFQTSGGLSFCTDYVEFGCCTVNDDTKLQQRYERIEQYIPPTKKGLWKKCSDYAKTFLCQTCSPYAAHIFDAEPTQYNDAVVQRAFPGLCRSHCSSFYQQCKELVWYYMEEAGTEHETEMKRLDKAVNQNETHFCEAIRLSDPDYCFPDLLTNPILNGNISIEKVTQEGCICVEAFDRPFRNPIFLKNANDGSNRMFVGEQIGLVHVMYPDGTVLPEPFLNIQVDVKTTASKGDERGLLGMEFHPRFKENGLFYMYYSTPLNVYERSQLLGDHKIRIEEFKVTYLDSNKANKTYRRLIMEVYEPWWNHNGGEILFGDDGYLYVFVGDGGRAGDPLNSGQDMFSMLGKVHRIDVNNVDYARVKNYSIPKDNPFADGVNGLPEIYAYGVRNIWRCGKDRGDPKSHHGKGRILCGDVGQSAVEEINLLEKGANYGWKLKEGTHDYCPYCHAALPETPLTDPVWDYTHKIGKSVTGGNFYRGCQSPNFNGFYFYGDFMSGRLFRLTEPKNPNQTRWNNKELKMCGTDWCKPPLSNDYNTSIISFGEDEDGEVYMLSTQYASTSVYAGKVYKLVDPNRRGNPENCKSSQKPYTTATSPVTTEPTPTTTVPESTTKRYVPKTTGKPTSKGNTVAPGDRRMESYLDYFKRHQRRKARRNLQNQFKEERENRLRNQMTYRGTPPPNYSRDTERGASSTNHHRFNHLQLVFHGINVQRCTNKPKFWCSLNRLLASK